MICYYESMEDYYGVGNQFSHHSPKRWIIELEPSDEYEVKEAILDTLEGECLNEYDFNSEINITLYCDKADDYFDFDECISDWFSEEEWIALVNKCCQRYPECCEGE